MLRRSRHPSVAVGRGLSKRLAGPAQAPRDVGVTVPRHSPTVSRINALLDRLPRTTVYLTGAESPVFRAVGVAGFHLAVLTMIGGALLRGLPLSTAVIIGLTCAASFFVWALLRRAITGHETLVLFEHVWLAGTTVAAVLWLLHAPLLPWLDVVAVALAVFLAAGRVGCAVAGCCHGHPSRIGIRYPEDHPVPRVAGTRVFPVPLIESSGLIVIALAGAAALPWEAPGGVLVWAMAAYAVLRFGMEALRGDHRPHVIGVPVARLAAGVQLVAALVVDTVRHGQPFRWQPVAVAVAGLFTASLMGHAWYRARPRPVTAERVAQVRARTVAAQSQSAGELAREPAVVSFSGGITVATTGTPDGVHLSVGGAGIGLEARQRLASAATGGGPVVVGPHAVAHAFMQAADRPWPAPRPGVGPDGSSRFTLPWWVDVPGHGDS